MFVQQLGITKCISLVELNQSGGLLNTKGLQKELVGCSNSLSKSFWSL